MENKTQQTLICNTCGLEKSSTEFRKDQHNPTGHASNCRTCFNKAQKEYRRKNRVIYNKKAVDYYHSNKSRINEMRRLRRQGKPTNTLQKTPDPTSYYSRIGWKRNREKSWRDRGIVKMTYKRFEEMLAVQNYSCLICQKHQDQVGTLHVDHCHDTGEVRGLLCNNCNNGLGKLGDSITILKQAIKYLEDAASK